MTEHTLWRENDQRLAPQAARLPAQQVEILRGSGGLADVHVAFGGELHEAFNARARVFRALAFVAVRQQQHQSGREPPFVFAGAEELIDDHLRAIRKIAELRFPENQRLWIVARKAVFKPQAAAFGERRVVNLAKSLIRRQMSKGEILLFSLRVDQNRMALVEGAALRILAGEAH